MSEPVVEQPLVIDCGGHPLVAVAHLPDSQKSRGVLVVVGGPQYRVGSHRQFVLLARDLAARGYPVLRFDYRGMGDAGGEMRDFEAIGDDIKSAVDAFFKLESALREVVIWGLCDAASAALFYAPRDPRIAGLVLLNPWAYTDEGAAQTLLKHYYLKRLVNPDLWKKIRAGRFDFAGAFRSLADIVKRVLERGGRGTADANGRPGDDRPLPERLLTGWTAFRRPILLILSGNDLTAKEFLAATAKDPAWSALLSRGDVTRHDFAAADHTFSRRAWRDEVAARTQEWLASW